jgi:hypothetical protein
MIAQVIVLLQLAISLLTAQNLTPDMQQKANDFANQAVALAIKSMEVPSSTAQVIPQVTPPIPQYVPPVLGTGPAVVENPPVITPTVSPVIEKPTCSFTAKLTQEGLDYNNNFSAQIDWSSTGIPADTKGMLYGSNGSDANGPLYNQPIAGTINSASGSAEHIYRSTFYKIDLGGATCYAKLDRNGTP